MTLRSHRTWAWLWLLAALLWLDGCAAPPRQGPSATTDQGLLWRIEGPGAAPSHLLGTMHSEDPRILDLPRPVEHAFDASQRLVLEAVLDGQARNDLAMAMYFRDGRTLEAVIGPSLYRQVAAALEPRGLPPSVIQHMKPWAVVNVLSTPPPDTGVFLDRRLQELAEEKGRPVFGLESVAEQLAPFEMLPLPYQINMLEEVLATREQLPLWTERMTQAYLDRDLAALQALAEAELATMSQPLQAFFLREFVVERNYRMAKRLRPWLKQGNSFIAIGALHLPGPQGLLQLLRDQGYRVEPVY